MLLHKLRIQRGWSQEQLSDLSGVSVRTIQRLEKGKPASVETLKNLGAVLDVPFDSLREQHMATETSATETLATDIIEPVQSKPQLDADEYLALRQVKKLKGFYIHAAQYAIVIPALALINLQQTDDPPLWFIYPALGWGLGLAFHAARVFAWSPFFSADWERQQVEKILKRKI